MFFIVLSKNLADKQIWVKTKSCIGGIGAWFTATYVNRSDNGFVLDGWIRADRDQT